MGGRLVGSGDEAGEVVLENLQQKNTTTTGAIKYLVVDCTGNDGTEKDAKSVFRFAIR